jgi:hypothetical protein
MEDSLLGETHDYRVCFSRALHLTMLETIRFPFTDGNTEC